MNNPARIFAAILAFIGWRAALVVTIQATDSQAHISTSLKGLVKQGHVGALINALRQTADRLEREAARSCTRTPF